MIYQPTHWVVDAERGTVAVDLTYRNVRKVGPALDMENGKFFDFDTAGRFKRVRFWTGTFIDQKASIAAARKAA